MTIGLFYFNAIRVKRLMFKLPELRDVARLDGQQVALEGDRRFITRIGDREGMLQ